MIWFLNGRFLPAKQAKLPVNDLAVLRGYGAFDFLVTYGKKPFLLDEHLDRLTNSAKLIGLPLPYTKEQIKKFTLKTIKRNRGKEFTIRLVATGGVSSSNIFPEGKSSLAILVGKRVPYPKACYQKGINLKTHHYQRFIPEAKHINYLTAVVAKYPASQKGFLEVLYVYQDQVLECTTSNFFLIKDGVLFTTEKQILQGITKKVVLKLAVDFLKIGREEIRLPDLKMADEAFISASDKEIMPVVRIDRLKIGSGRPGPLTKKLMKAFREYTKSFSLHEK